MILIHQQQQSIPNFFPTAFTSSGFTVPSLFVIRPESTGSKDAPMVVAHKEVKNSNSNEEKKQLVADATTKEGPQSSEARITYSYRTQNAVIHETKQDYCVSFDLPGVKEDNILVELDNKSGVLTLQAERRHGNKKILKLREKLALDTTVIDTSKEVLSSLEDGVLTLTFKKRDDVEPLSVAVVAADPPTTEELDHEGKGLFLRMDVPGVKSSDAQVEFIKGRLHVEYDRKNRRSTTTSSSDKFRRTFIINEAAIDVQKLKAYLMDGVLTVTAPAKPAEPAQKIKVTSKKQESQSKSEEEESDSKQENKTIVVETVTNNND